MFFVCVCTIFFLISMFVCVLSNDRIELMSYSKVVGNYH